MSSRHASAHGHPENGGENNEKQHSIDARNRDVDGRHRRSHRPAKHHKSSHRSSKSEDIAQSRKKDRKKGTRVPSSSDNSDDCSVESNDRSYERERKRHKKERKKDKKREKKNKKSRGSNHDDDLNSTTPVSNDFESRNHALADALCDLLERHAPLATDLPLMLIRLASGASFDLSQMTDIGAAQGLARVFKSLEPFGIQQQQQQTNARQNLVGSLGAWVWKDPSSNSSTLKAPKSTNSNELVLIRVVRAMLDQAGMTIEAIREFESPRTNPLEIQNNDRSNDTSSKVVVAQTTELLRSFHEGELASELAGLCQMILEGEVISLDGLPNAQLRHSLECLFVECGLEKSEMDSVSSDETTDKEESVPIAGFGLPNKRQNMAKAKLSQVVMVCRASDRRQSVKGPQRDHRAYDYDDVDDHRVDNQADDSSCEEVGPLPLGAAERAHAVTLSREQVRAAAARRAKELACAKQGIEFNPADGDVREEWMVVPGKFDFLSAIKSGQPMRSRQFESKNRATEDGPDAPVDPATEAEIHAIRNAYEKTRGRSLMEVHHDEKKAELGRKQSASWQWNRDKDLDSGRRVDNDALQTILGGAGSDLKTKFQSSL